MHIVDNLLGYVAHKQRARGGRRNAHVRIAFDDIAEWYSGSADAEAGARPGHDGEPRGFKYGHEVISWLELLDMSKWIRLIS